jgi:hypothetical protein
LVSLIDPIGARRIENVEIDRVFERLSFVRHVGGDAENFAGVDNDFLTVDPELQRSVENVSELFVMVAVLGNDATFFKEHARQHNFLADDELPSQQWIQIFERNGVPGNVLVLGFAGRVFGDGALRARVGLGLCCLSASNRLGFQFFRHSDRLDFAEVYTPVQCTLSPYSFTALSWR